MNYIIGVDAGTTAFKAGLYDETLKPVCQVSEEYHLVYTPNGFVEFPAEGFWDIFCRLMQSLFAQVKISPSQILGLSICSQGETLICLDSQGQPLADAIIWTDARATAEARAINGEFQRRVIFEVTGQREAATTWPACKILWIKNHRSDIFEKTDKFLLLEDFLVYRLTGVYATNKSLASSTLLLDIYNGSWWEDMLKYIGVSEQKLPGIYESGQRIAGVCQVASQQTGLAQDTAVISGALDQASGMLGSGNIHTGIVSETTGTCLAVCASIGNVKIPYEHGLLPIHHGVIPSSYYSIYWSAAAGSIHRWIGELFYGNEQADRLYGVIEKEAKAVPPGSDGLLLLPYLSGINFPMVLESASGVLSGITLAHTRGHFARAVLESIAYMLRQSIDEIAGYGIEADYIYSLGGGASSRLWNQIKANVTGKEIRTLGDGEVTCRGAAMLAVVGVGMYADLKAVVGKCVTVETKYRPEGSGMYNDLYRRFLQANDGYLSQMKEAAMF